MRHRSLLGLAASAAVAATVLVPTHPASAHPLGNLTVNTYAGIVVAADAVRVDYVVDLAELPTVQAQQRIDTDGDRTSSASEMDAYRTAECTTLASGRRAGGPRPLRFGRSRRRGWCGRHSA